MKYSDDAMCALLLCSYLGKRDQRPLTITEWNELLERVSERGEAVDCILKGNAKEKLQELGYDGETCERIERLIDSGTLAALELEELNHRGIQAVTQFDNEYPRLLKRRLKKKTPPILFYAGELALANKVGVAIVGSRNVDEKGTEFAKSLSKKVSNERLLVYSGGARGVDSVSEQTALENDGAVVSFLADSLLARIKRREIIEAVQNGRMLLFSDVKPDVGFSPARAMNRNKYIYAGACAAFAVSADYNKGGTWAGAMENLKNNWSKMFVWDCKEYQGNKKLIENGALPYELNEQSIYELISKKQTDYRQQSLFHPDFVYYDYADEGKEQTVIVECMKPVDDFFYRIERYLLAMLDKEITVSNLARKTNVTEEQMNIWLNRLCKSGKVKCMDNKYIKTAGGSK